MKTRAVQTPEAQCSHGSLRSRIQDRIRQSEDGIFLPADFMDMADRSQVLRALAQLVRDGRLVRLGRGIYASARLNKATGKLTVDYPGGFSMAARQALTRLGIPWKETELVQEHNAGLTTQIPARIAIVVPKQFRRPLELNGMQVLYVDR